MNSKLKQLIRGEAELKFYKNRGVYYQRAKTLLKNPLSLTQLAVSLGTENQCARIIIDDLLNNKYNIKERGNKLQLISEIQAGASTLLNWIDLIITGIR